MDKLKLCKDCKWIGKNWIMPFRLQYCYNKEVINLEGDPINGKIFADIARNHGPCFRVGKYWEPNQ